MSAEPYHCEPCGSEGDSPGGHLAYGSTEAAHDMREFCSCALATCPIGTRSTAFAMKIGVRSFQPVRPVSACGSAGAECTGNPRRLRSRAA